MRVPESYIAEQLGHANKTVTQNYFDSYTKEERITYNSMLL
jgi:integrase